MKIRLFALNSSFVHTNLALRSLGSVLRSHGHQVNLTEKTIKDKRDAVLEELFSADADIYCFSVYIWNREEMFRYAASLKKLKPGCRILFGGPEVSFPENDFFDRFPFVDVLICGEGEDVIADALNAERHSVVQGRPFRDFTNSGILYDEFLPPSDTNILYYESARGCPFRCAYCLSSLSGGVRAKSAEQTLSQLRQFEQFGNQAKIVKLIDRTFNFDIDRANRIWAALLDGSFSLHYHFEICADLLNEESFSVLSKFPKGKIQLEIGVQSIHDQTLSASCRKTDTELVLTNIKRLYSLGNIHIHADLIAGLPYESYELFGRSYDALAGKCDMLQLGFLKLLHGSALRTRAKENKTVFDEAPPYTVLATPWISYTELMKLHRLDDVTDRILNSGHFKETLTVLFDLLKSPFAFFTDFAEQTPDLHKISQSDLFVRFYRYIGDSFSETTTEFIRERLVLDWYLHENRGCPDSVPDSGTPKLTDEEQKKAIATGGNRSSVIYRRFSFGLVEINRKEETYRVISN